MDGWVASLQQPMNNENVSQLSVQQLRQIIALREKIETLEADIAGIVGGTVVKRGPGRPPGRPLGRPPGRPPAAAVAAVGAPEEAKSGRRKMSAAARQRISASAKARWAKARAAGQATLKDAGV